MSGEAVMISCVFYASVAMLACHLADKERENNRKQLLKQFEERKKQMLDEHKKRKERLNYNRLD
jgi:cytochrome c556